MKPWSRNMLSVPPALSAGLALGMALCGHNLFWLAWVTLVPLFVVLNGATVKRTCAPTMKSTTFPCFFSKKDVRSMR